MTEGGNPGKRAALKRTVLLLEAALAFFLDFFFDPSRSAYRVVPVVSSRTGEVQERMSSPDKLLTWAEEQAVQTRDHPAPLHN